MVKAVFAGSFDPPTNGHLDIIKRASKLFDSIDVVISYNPQKKYLFSENERFDMVNEIVKGYKNVSVHIWQGLIVKYAEQAGAKVLIRGIRSTTDFEYEFQLAHMNQNLNSKIETLFLPTKEKYAIIKSSSIKEVAMFGGDISNMVPSNVEKAVKDKYASNQLNNSEIIL